MSSVLPVRVIDPRAQRLGAALSAATIALAVIGGLAWLAAIVGVALAVSAARGTSWFLFSRPWPWVRRVLRLGPPVSVEPELGPRFAQALGATFVLIGLASLAAGLGPLGWLPIGAVAVLQALLAGTGYCLGCRLYGLHWLLPALFDRYVLRVPASRG